MGPKGGQCGMVRSSFCICVCSCVVLHAAQKRGAIIFFISFVLDDVTSYVGQEYSLKH